MYLGMFFVILGMAFAIFLMIFAIAIIFDDGGIYSIIYGSIGLIILLSLFIWTDTGNGIVKKINIFHRNTPAENISKRLDQLNQLNSGLQQKLIEVRQLQREYKKGIIELKKEIYVESQKNSIVTYSQAASNVRINYDLQLIQRRIALIKKMDDTELRLINGIEQVRFISLQTRDDLGIAKAFTGKEAKQLLKDINKTIDEYSPDSKEINLDINESMLIPLEQIWQSLQTEIKNQ